MRSTEPSHLEGALSPWRVEFMKTALQQFEKLDKPTPQAINRYIERRLAVSEDPKRFGKPLSGDLKEFCRYRIEDYRLICNIRDKELLILVVRGAHRRHVYE